MAFIQISSLSFWVFEKGEMFEYHIIDTTNANYQSGTHFILGK